jgi:hypothetical protein
MTPNSTSQTGPTTQLITAWIENYVHAWETNDTTDIEALFTEDAEYHEGPYTTEWIGRDDIVKGWQSRWAWQHGGWSFEWSIDKIDGMVVSVSGIGRYTELGNFDNAWTITFDPSGRCSRFEMVNTERA